MPNIFVHPTQSAQVRDVAVAVNGFSTLCLTEVGLARDNVVPSHMNVIDRK